MDNPPHYSESPRASVLHPNETPQETHSSEPSDNSERTNSDKLSALPGDVHSPGTPYRPGRSDRSTIPVSYSAPSLQSLMAPRPFPTSPESHDARPSTSDESSGQHSSQQRVSFDGNRPFTQISGHSSPRANAVTVHPLLREAISKSLWGLDSTRNRVASSSEPTRPPSIVRVAARSDPLRIPDQVSPPRSAPQSRATSPIRLFNWSGFHQAREDPFIPGDPFQHRGRARFRRFSFHSADIENRITLDPMCQENYFCCLPQVNCSPKDRVISFLQDAHYFIMGTLPRQIYLHLLLRLPSLYFSRIARVYEDAQLSKPDFERMIESYSGSRQKQQREGVASPIPPGSHFHRPPVLPFPDEWTTANASPALVRFKHSWEAFIDSLLREWKTLNLVSALLHSAIISMFQSPEMAYDPIIRTAALLSLMCALISLSFGCIYIVRFGTMRSMYKATRWAEEAARTTTFILWNVWVLLAMPAVWLAWSMIFFVVAILAFVWRTGSTSDPASPTPLSPTAAIGPRVAVSTLFLIGLVYFAAIVRTLHNYGLSHEHYHHSFGRAGMASESDAQEGDWRSRTERGRNVRGRNQGFDSIRGATRGRDPTRRGPRERGLSAVMGLDLTNLDGLAGSPGSDEMFREKQQHQIGASM